MSETPMSEERISDLEMRRSVGRITSDDGSELLREIRRLRAPAPDVDALLKPFEEVLISLKREDLGRGSYLAKPLASAIEAVRVRLTQAPPSEPRWVIVATGEGSEARIVTGEIHQAVHDFMCVCGKPYGQCDSAGIQQDLALLDDSENWANDEDDKPFSIEWECETGTTMLYRLGAFAQAPPDPWARLEAWMRESDHKYQQARIAFDGSTMTMITFESMGTGPTLAEAVTEALGKAEGK